VHWQFGIYTNYDDDDDDDDDSDGRCLKCKLGYPGTLQYESKK